MRKLMQRSRDEDGAVVAIVVLSLIAIMGMVVLTVDVGGMVVRRREMVNANDAAALAAAIAFAQQENGAECGVTEDPATDAANQMATTNVSGSTRASFTTDCADRTVSVVYQKDQQLFFASVLGFADSATVNATATAKWGAAGSASPVPVVAYETAFNNCKLDTDGISGSRCFVWEDNNNTQGSQSAFGLLDLGSGWDTSAAGKCPNPGSSDVRGWIDGSVQVGDLSVAYPGATYVCRVSGMAETVWAALSERVGQVLYFPINRCDATLPGNSYGQVGTSGAEVACSGTPDKYDIIGFVAFKLIQVYRPNDVEVGWTACAPATSVPFPGSSPLSLDWFGQMRSCFTAAPDQIDSASVSVENTAKKAPKLTRGPDGTACSASNSWCYDPAGRRIIWGSGPSGSYTVAFDFRNPGPCGYPPAGNNSGHCLVVDYVKKHLGGGNPGGGFPGSNLQSVTLVK